MKFIGAIAAMTEDRVIGRDNDIPWHYAEDFKRFKRVTLGGAILMGRKTWESIGSKPLPGRRNIVISRSRLVNNEAYDSIPKAIAACACDDQKIWFIGGGQIYDEAIDYCNQLDITIVPDQIEVDNAVLFPKISADKWQLEAVFSNEKDARLQTKIYTRKR